MKRRRRLRRAGPFSPGARWVGSDHDSIADVLADGTSALFYAARHGLQVLSKQSNEVLWRQGLGDGGEAHDVGEKYCHLTKEGA